MVLSVIIISKIVLKEPILVFQQLHVYHVTVPVLHVHVQQITVSLAKILCLFIRDNVTVVAQ